MKITKLEATVIKVPWTQTFLGGISESKGSLVGIDFLESVILKLHTDDGLVGIGEGTLSYGGSKGRAMLEDIKSSLASIVLGQNPMHIERIMDQLDLVTMLEQRNPAKSAIDLALHDLIGKTLNIPLYEYFGGPYRKEIPITYVISYKGKDAMVEEAQGLKDRGFKGVLKVKAGADYDDEILRILNETMEGQTPIRVDFNGVLTASESIQRIKRWERDGIHLELMEQPAPLGDIDGMKRVADAIGSGVLVHWPIMNLTDVANLIKSDALAAAAITIPGVGGLHRSRQMVYAFETANIPCVIGSFLEMGVVTAAQLHLTTAMRNFKYPVDVLGPFTFHKDEITTQSFRWPPGGVAVCPDGPGLGIELDHEKINHYKVTDTYVQSL